MPISSNNLQSEISNLKFPLTFERFQSRHIGPDPDERDAMLKVIGASSLEALMDEAIPARIRRKTPLNLPEGLSEHHFLRELRQTAGKHGALVPWDRFFRSCRFTPASRDGRPMAVRQTITFQAEPPPIAKREAGGGSGRAKRRSR